MDDYDYGEGSRLHCPPFIKKLWDLMNGPYKEVSALNDCRTKTGLPTPMPAVPRLE